MNLIAVFVQNKPGQTAQVTRILAGAGVNIRWVTIASSGTFGVMKFLVDKVEPGVAALKKAGLMVSLVDVLAVEVTNQPGTLADVAEGLSRNNINLANCSGFVANNRAILVVEVQELAQATAILQQQGLALLTQDQMLNL